MPLIYREGSKYSIAKKILPYIPEHSIYVEMFFGAGGLFFNKPLAQYNIVNDYDKEIMNLYFVVRDHKAELIQQLDLLPNDQNLFNYWKKNHETEPVKKAIRLLYLSNFSYMGTSESFHTIWDKTAYKKNIYFNLETVYKSLVNSNVTLLNLDFRKVIDSIALKTTEAINNTFIYADPPYLETRNRYNVPEKWKYQDSKDLFEILVKSKCRFIISEFDNPKILDLAQSYNLRVINLITRMAMKGYRNEILITNMDNINYQPDLFE